MSFSMSNLDEDVSSIITMRKFLIEFNSLMRYAVTIVTEMFAIAYISIREKNVTSTISAFTIKKKKFFSLLLRVAKSFLSKT